MAAGLPVAKALIKYNSLKENEEEKESIDIELTEQKHILIMMKMLLILNDQVYKKKTMNILLWLTSLINYKSNMMRKILPKSNWMIV